MLAVAQVDVLTQHNDLFRSGANSRETMLTTDGLLSGRFGKLAMRPVDGNIYAQPLVVAGLRIAGRPTPHNAVIIATEHNSVWAFDADDTQPDSASALLWHTGPDVIGSSVPSDVLSASIAGGPGRCVDLTPEIGITSTPAIALDAARPRGGVVFVVAKTLRRKDDYEYALWALDLADGRPVGPPTPIAGAVPGTGKGASGSGRDRRILFDARIHLNRPGLALHERTLYVALGSHCDRGNYHGWLFAYDVSAASAPRLIDVWASTPNGKGRLGGAGGIWMSGQAPAIDRDGSVFLSTGDGSYDGVTEFGNSVIRLLLDDSRFRVLDWFTPDHHARLNADDVDLGSSGVLLVPDAPLALTAGKEGRMYLLDRASMGKGRAPPLQSIQVTNPPFPSDRPRSYWNLHGTPVVWRRSDRADQADIYIWGEEDRLKQYRLARVAPEEGGGWRLGPPVAMSQESAPYPDHPTGRFNEVRRGQNAVWMPGAFLSLSSDGDRDGTAILWAALPIDADANHRSVRGRLRAYDARNVSRLLWDSEDDPDDGPGLFAKFCPPTIANGKVYLATFGEEETRTRADQPHRMKPGGQSPALVIYGLH